MENVAFAADATATTDTGILTCINVEPGRYTVSFSHETLTCVSGAGFTANGDALDVEVVADELAYFSV